VGTARGIGPSKWKEVENDSRYSIANNLFMELKNSNPNGCNVVLTYTPYFFIFFPKILKIEFKKGFQSYYFF